MKKTLIFFVLVLGIACPLFAQDTSPGTYTLPQCITLSLGQSPAVLAAEKEVERINGVVWETWSNIVSVDISADYTDVERGAPVSVLSTRGGVTIDLEGSVPVFSGGRVINGVLTAYLSRDLAGEEYRKAVDETVYGVVTSFSKILLDREVVKVRTEEVDFLSKTHDFTQDKYDRGLASRFELLRTEVELANAQPSLMEAEDSLAGDTDDLEKLLGIGVGEPFEAVGELPYREVSLDLDECLKKARLQNPDILIASLQEEIARKAVRSVIGEYFPTVSVFGRYENAADDVNVSFNSDDWDFIGGVMVTVPITDLLSISARLKQARASYEQAKINRRDVESGIVAEVRRAHRDLVRSRNVVESQKKNVLLAKESLDIAQLQYENGINTYLELMDTQLALTQANLNYVNAVYGYVEAAARLQMLTGDKITVPGTDAAKETESGGSSAPTDPTQTPTP
jgi:outer membrane protein